MLFIYLPKCKPFYKFSILTLQLQIGLKCNLIQSKGFGLSSIKTNIKDTFGLPESLYDFLSTGNEQNSTEGIVFQPLPFDSPEAVSVQLDSTEAMVALETMVGQPPSPPQGYVLWQKQALKERKDARGQPLTPHIIELDGWKFVRPEDLDDFFQLPPSSIDLPERPKVGEELEEMIQEAWIKEYIYTGNRDADLEALNSHIVACRKVICILDPSNESTRTPDRFKLRMDMMILMESLKEEFEVLASEAGGSGYHGFDGGPVSSAEFPSGPVRPKGYRWASPGWL